MRWIPKRSEKLATQKESSAAMHANKFTTHTRTGINPCLEKQVHSDLANELHEPIAKTYKKCKLY